MKLQNDCGLTLNDRRPKLHVALKTWRSYLHRLNALEVTDMTDYETLSLVVLIIGLVISAVLLGITIGKKDKNNRH